jgi:hypothetical protein
MPTEQEIITEIKKAAWSASITVDEWIKRVRTNPSYAWTKTAWYRELKAAEKLRSLGQPAPVPPPPPPPANAGSSWILMGENPEKALWYPTYYGIAFTADVGINDNTGQKNYPWPSAATVKTLKDRGQRVRAWCDCHSTMPDSAYQMSDSLGLGGVIGEGESAGAFDNAYNAGMRLMVGNISALRDDQLVKIGPEVTWINELYLNDDPSIQENWRNRPVVGRLVACYHGYPFQNYLNLGKYRPGIDSFYDPGATDADRYLVP